MLEDDTAFNAAYHALTTFERSLTVRQVFQIRPVRVRFQKTQLPRGKPRESLKHLARAQKRNFNENWRVRGKLVLGGRDSAEAGWIAV